MSWSYNSDMITEKDQVRFLVQDTSESRQIFQDEEINWQLSQEANLYMAAAALCDILVVRTGGVRRKKISQLEIEYNVDFRALSAQYRARGLSHQVPYVGGISIAEKIAVQGDTDRTPPAFSRDLGDNPAAPSPSVNPPHSLTDL